MMFHYLATSNRQTSEIGVHFALIIVGGFVDCSKTFNARSMSDTEGC